ncbi:MAG: peptidylprolyl isomerase, partial [Methanobacteriaceae archaeon]
YDIELVDVITDDTEKIKSMIELHYSYPNMDIEKTEVDITDGVAKIKLDEITRFDQKSYMDITFARFRISKDIWDNIDDVEKVEFVDVFEDKAEDTEANESSEEQKESEE